MLSVMSSVVEVRQDSSTVHLDLLLVVIVMTLVLDAWNRQVTNRN